MLRDQRGYPRPVGSANSDLTRHAPTAPERRSPCGHACRRHRQCSAIRAATSGESRSAATSLTTVRRATFPDAMGATSLWSRPRQLQLRGGSFIGFAGQSLVGASDGEAPGGPRADRVSRRLLGRSARVVPPGSSRRRPPCNVRPNPRNVTSNPPGEPGWGRPESNGHGAQAASRSPSPVRLPIPPLPHPDFRVGDV